MSAHVRRATGVAVLSLATALAQTAPLALHLGSAIPFGTYPAPVVPRLNLWALWWNSERLLHGYRGYWQAPIFAGGRLLVVDRRQPGRAYDAVLPMAFASGLAAYACGV